MHSDSISTQIDSFTLKCPPNQDVMRVLKILNYSTSLVTGNFLQLGRDHLSSRRSLNFLPFKLKQCKH